MSRITSSHPGLCGLARQASTAVAFSWFVALCGLLLASQVQCEFTFVLTADSFPALVSAVAAANTLSASSLGRVELQAGTYVVAQHLDILRSMYLVGSSDEHAPTILDCQQQLGISALNIASPGVHVQNVTFVNCLYDPIVVNLTASMGSGSSPVVVDGCTFKNNIGVHAGALYSPAYADIAVTSCIFVNNSASPALDGDYEADYDYGYGEVTHPVYPAAALRLGPGNATIANCMFSDHYMNGYSVPDGEEVPLVPDGAVDATIRLDCDATSITTLTVQGCSFFNSTARLAGGISMRAPSEGEVDDISTAALSSCSLRVLDSSFQAVRGHYSGAVRFMGGDITAQLLSVVVSGTSFTDCHAPHAGTVHVAGRGVKVNVMGSTLDQITGGGLSFMDGVDGTVTGCSFSNIVGANIGGIMIYYGGLTVEDTTFVNMSGHNDYGAIFAHSVRPFVVSNSHFIGSTGTALYAMASLVQVYNSQFIGGRMQAGARFLRGGGIWLDNAQYGSTFVNCSFIDNEAFLGGAVHLTGHDTLIISGSTFIGNRAYSGGAVMTDFNQKDVIITDCLFKDNWAGLWPGTSGDTSESCGPGGGGALCVRGAYGYTILVNHTQLVNNSAIMGGAVYASASAKCSTASGCYTLSIEGSDLIDNTAQYGGGAVYFLYDRLLNITCTADNGGPSDALMPFDGGDAFRPAQLAAGSLAEAAAAAAEANNGRVLYQLPCASWVGNNATASGGYGDTIGSSAFYARAERADGSGPLASGVPVEIVVTLLDYYGQKVTNSTSDVPVLVVSDANNTLGQTIISVTQGGTARFTQLRLRDKVGRSYNVTFGATSPLRVLTSNAVQIALRACRAGEITAITGDACTTCPPGTYSTSGDLTACMDCPDGADCSVQGISRGVVVPLDGMWHSSYYSTQLFECPSNEACAFSGREVLLGQLQESILNGTLSRVDLDMYRQMQCAAGYHGIMCSRCDDGYGQNAKGDCRACPHPLVNLVYYLLAGCLTLFAVAVTIRSSLEVPDRDAEDAAMAVELAASTMRASMRLQNPDGTDDDGDDESSDVDRSNEGFKQLEGPLKPPTAVTGDGAAAKGAGGGVEVVGKASAATGGAVAAAAVGEGRDGGPAPTAAADTPQPAAAGAVGGGAAVMEDAAGRWDPSTGDAAARGGEWELMQGQHGFMLPSQTCGENGAPVSATASGSQQQQGSWPQQQPQHHHQQRRRSSAAGSSRASSDGGYDAAGHAHPHPAVSAGAGSSGQPRAGGGAGGRRHSSSSSVAGLSPIPSPIPHQAAVLRPRRASAMMTPDVQKSEASQTRSRRVSSVIQSSGRSLFDMLGITDSRRPVAPVLRGVISKDSAAPAGGGVARSEGSATSGRSVRKGAAAPQAAPVTAVGSTGADVVGGANGQQPAAGGWMPDAFGGISRRQGGLVRSGGQSGARVRGASSRAVRAGSTGVSFADGDASDWRSEHGTVVKILVSFVQVVALVKTAPVEWPHAMLNFFTILGQATSVASQLVSLDCLLNPKLMPFMLQKVLIDVASPFYLTAIILTFWLIRGRRLAKLGQLPGDETLSLYMKQRAIITVSCVVFVTYPNVTVALFSLFACRTLDPPDGQTVCTDTADPATCVPDSSTEGLYWLYDFDEQCYTGNHLIVAMGVGIPGVLLWALGAPLVGWLWLRANRHRLQDTDFRVLYGYMYQEYEPAYYYWECIVMLRKLAVTAVVVFFGTYKWNLLLLAAMGIICMAMVFQIAFRPYRLDSMDDLEKVALVTTLATFYVAMYFDPSSSLSLPIKQGLAILMIILNVVCLTILGLAVVREVAREYVVKVLRVSEELRISHVARFVVMWAGMRLRKVAWRIRRAAHRCVVVASQLARSSAATCLRRI